MKPIIKDSLVNLGTEVMVSSAPLLAHSELLRRTAIHTGETYINSVRKSTIPSVPRLVGVSQDLNEFGNVFVHMADRLMAGHYSRPVLRSMARNLFNGMLADGGQQAAISRFRETNGHNPPGFLAISPGKTCNLRCRGCYANSGANSERLDWITFDRIITEAKTLWGVRLIAITGGEPMAYRSDGKGVLDVAAKHPEILFIMYTNGTLITNEVADRMARLGNLTPAISVEGWRARTDERRGKGVYDQALAAMARLRRAGVPFGISLTATRHNVEEILSDEFLDFFFEKQEALYGWIFQYMPIGRSFTLDLMPTPEQRVWMWKRSWEVVKQRHIFLGDFWNHATLSDGCLAGARTNGWGYVHIDWNGSVSPCVFVPYSPTNIRDVYDRGGTINDLLKEPFFTDIREWQSAYRKKHGNWLAPCIIRDHYHELKKMIAKNEPDPTDENARQAIIDPAYARGLEEYDAAYQSLTEPIWQKQYLQSGIVNNHPNQPSTDR